MNFVKQSNMQSIASTGMLIVSRGVNSRSVPGSPTMFVPGVSSKKYAESETSPLNQTTRIKRAPQSQGNYWGWPCLRRVRYAYMIPKKIYREQPDRLVIEWDNGHRSLYRLQVLRQNCPCAGCLHDAGKSPAVDLLPVLTPGKNELRSVTPVGNYAIQFEWGDGHRTGIYSFEFLRKICDCNECRQNPYPSPEEN